MGILGSKQAPAWQVEWDLLQAEAVWPRSGCSARKYQDTGVTARCTPGSPAALPDGGDGRSPQACTTSGPVSTWGRAMWPCFGRRREQAASRKKGKLSETHSLESRAPGEVRACPHPVPCLAGQWGPRTTRDPHRPATFL